MLAVQAEAAPDDPATQVRLGALALQQGASPGAAAAHFQRAIDLSLREGSQDPAAWLAYGLWANSLGNTGQITQALEIVNQGLAALPDNLALQTMQTRWQGGADPASSDEAFRAALEAGRSATRERRWEEAIALTQQAIAQGPGRYEAQLLLGDAYRGLGEISQALQAYQRAAELAPYLSILHSRQAEMLARLGRIDEALAASLTALAIDQGRWENWYGLGRAYMAQRAEHGGQPGRHCGGMELHARSTGRCGAVGRGFPAPCAVAGAGREPGAGPRPGRAAGRAACACGRGHAGAGRAVRGHEWAGARSPSAPRPTKPCRPASRLRRWSSISSWRPWMARTAPAAWAWRTRWPHWAATTRRWPSSAAISLDWPDFPFAYIRQGALLEEQGALEGALAAYREAVRVAPDNPDTHFTLAYALSRAGQRAEAIAAFEAGLALDPGRSAARQTLEEIMAAK